MHSTIIRPPQYGVQWICTNTVTTAFTSFLLILYILFTVRLLRVFYVNLSFVLVLFYVIILHVARIYLVSGVILKYFLGLCLMLWLPSSSPGKPIVSLFSLIAHTMLHAYIITFSCFFFGDCPSLRARAMGVLFPCKYSSIK